MRITGATMVAASPVLVRERLGDPERLCEALPNADGFSWLEGPGSAAFALTFRPALALGEIPIRTTWRRLDGKAGELRYNVEGRTDEQRVALDIALRIGAADAGAEVVWTVDCQVTGTLRSAGQRVIGPIIAHQVRMVLNAAEDVPPGH